MEIGAAVGAAGAAGVFEYNRKNFLYDRKMRQETEYKIMDFRILQSELWREDVRDIIGLTAAKMDTYLVLNTVQLGFVVLAFCEGRLALGTPAWLIGCHTLSLAGSFMFLLMSIWLAMQAVITAKAYEVRLMTQLVRLPIPTWAQLEGARTYASAYEKVESKQMFRVPFVAGTQESVLNRNAQNPPALANAPESTAGSAAVYEDVVETVGACSDVWGLEGRGDTLYELDGKARVDPSQLRHLRLVREAMQYWQGYDAFSRVAMSIGTIHLIIAMSYYVLGYVLISNHAIFASWSAVGLFMTIACALVRLDMSLKAWEYRIMVTLMIAGPCLTSLATEQWSKLEPDASPDKFVFINILMAVAFACHVGWTLSLLVFARVVLIQGAAGVYLPSGFRSVLYMDAFGWIRKTAAPNLVGRSSPNFASPSGRQGSSQGQSFRRAETESFRTSEMRIPSDTSTGPESCAGPAVQSVQYDEYGMPMPFRPEALPGAAKASENVQVREEHFVPTTFVPWEKEVAGAKNNVYISNPIRPGIVPWHIFSTGLILMGLLWGMLGTYHVVSNYQEYVEWKASAQRTKLREKKGKTALFSVQQDDESGLLYGSLKGGRAIKTEWPSLGVRPNGLSCGGDASNPWVVASTRFGLFATNFDVAASEVDSASASLSFQAAPDCASIEGEALQDVAVRCASQASGDDGKGSEFLSRRSKDSAADCNLLVLHQQGQRLSECPLPGSGHMQLQSSHLGAVSTAWLAEANSADGAPQEEVSFVAFDGPSGRAYAQTNGHRIVELQAGRGEEEGGRNWFPARVLQAGLPEPSAASNGGGMSVLGDSYLAVLHERDQMLEAIELRPGETPSKQSEDPAKVRYWRLPEDHYWGASCSVGDHIFLLEAGLTPQLWQFPLPAELQSTSSKDL